MLIEFVIGDWSGDGHDKTDTFVYKTNRTMDALIDAFKKGSKLIGLPKSTNRWHDGIRFAFCEEYEDNRIPEEVVIKLREHGIDIKDHAEGFCGYDEDESENDSDWMIDSKGFCELWLRIAQYADSSIVYKSATSEVETINMLS